MRRIKLFLIFITLFGFYVFVPKTHSLCAAGELYVGYAKLVITPQISIKMSGYSNRTERSKGVHDPLYVRVLVLDVDGYRIGIISCDLIGYYNRGILDVARERFNISHLLICSSHTHSGPNLSDSDSYARSVEKSMIDGLDIALRNMFPARISAGYVSFPQLGYNRLLLREEGHARALFVDYDRIPYGPVDPEVGVIKIEDKNGNPRVILISYACHPVVNRGNFDISADYPGIATRKVDETFGNNAMCMFVQGGGGDINPIFRNSTSGPPTDYGQIEKMGTLLANEVTKVVKHLTPKIEEKIILKAICDSLKFTGRFDKNLDYNLHFTTVLINNDIAISTMPGEPFVQHQLYWKKHAEVPNPFFFGYTFSSGGDSPGYVPDVRSSAYGGYGADNRERQIQVGAGEIIMIRHLENLYRLKGIMRNKPGPE